MQAHTAAAVPSALTHHGPVSFHKAVGKTAAPRNHDNLQYYCRLQARAPHALPWSRGSAASTNTWHCQGHEIISQQLANCLSRNPHKAYMAQAQRTQTTHKHCTSPAAAALCQCCIVKPQATAERCMRAVHYSPDAKLCVLLQQANPIQTFHRCRQHIPQLNKMQAELLLHQTGPPPTAAAADDDLACCLESGL